MTDWEVGRLKNAIDDLAHWLSRIQARLDTIAVNTDPANKASDPHPTLPIPVTATLNLPIAAAEYYESNKKRKWPEGLKWLLEISAIAAALWIGCLNLRVLWQIEKQTPKIAKSADATQSASQTATLTMRLGERAWLAVRYPMINLNVGSRISVPLVFENTGKTPAKNLKGVIRVTVIKASAKPDFSYTKGYYSWNSGYLSQTTTAPTNWNALDAKTRQDLILTQAILDAIQSGEQVVSVNGKIEYDDIFKIHHWLNFCQQAAGRPTGMTVSADSECTDYNQIDSNE